MSDSMMPIYGYGFLLPKAGGFHVRAKFQVAIYATPICIIFFDEV
jgi:hypothetical protein